MLSFPMIKGDKKEGTKADSVAPLATGTSSINKKKTSNDSNDKSKEELPNTRAYFGLGFIDPKIKLSSLADDIEEGEERVCMVSVMYSPDELYLVFAEEFPDNVNAFIIKTGDLYRLKIWSTRRRDLLPQLDSLTPGATVCVFHQEEEEWKRAEIVQKSDDTTVATSYKVKLLDLGEYHTIKKVNIMYLHREMARQPVYAIKARLEFKTLSNEQSGKDAEWKQNFRDAYLRYCYNQRVRVKFVRRENREDGPIWVVSLLDFDNGRVDGISKKRPIENQIFEMVYDFSFPINTTNVSGEDW